MLRPGLIFDLATDAGIKQRGAGDTRPIRCPFHDDESPSALASAEASSIARSARQAGTQSIGDRR